MDLSHHVVLDATSGTFFGASNAVILDTRTLPDLEALDNGSDHDRCQLAQDCGTDLEAWAPPVDRQALNAIAGLLDGQAWTPEHLNAIAEVVRTTGRPIAGIQP